MAHVLDSLIRAALRAAVRAQTPPPALRRAVLRAAGRRGAADAASWWETQPLWDAWRVPFFRAPLVA